MNTTETPQVYGRRARMYEERNLALLAVPAASTNGSTGRQQVKAARTLPIAESAAANAPFEEGLPVVLAASVFMGARLSLRTNGTAGKAHSHPHSYDAERCAYRHSSRNAMPTPMRTNSQTK